MNKKEAIKFDNTELDDIIELKNITQIYDSKAKGQVTIIKDLNLLIEDKPNQGQFVVILGHSGCGKSTLLRYIAGLQKPTLGEVLIHEKPRTKDTRVSMVFQQYSSLPWWVCYCNDLPSHPHGGPRWWLPLSLP